MGKSKIKKKSFHSCLDDFQDKGKIAQKKINFFMACSELWSKTDNFFGRFHSNYNIFCCWLREKVQKNKHIHGQYRHEGIVQDYVIEKQNIFNMITLLVQFQMFTRLAIIWGEIDIFLWKNMSNRYKYKMQY